MIRKQVLIRKLDCITNKDNRKWITKQTYQGRQSLFNSLTGVAVKSFPLAVLSTKNIHNLDLIKIHYLHN